MKCVQESKKYGAKQLLKMFPNKNWSLGGLKALIKKLTTQVCCSTYWVVVDLALSAQYLGCQFFFSQPRLQFLLENILGNRFAPCFLLSLKDMIKYLSSVLIPIIDV